MRRRPGAEEEEEGGEERRSYTLSWYTSTNDTFTVHSISAPYVGDAMRYCHIDDDDDDDDGDNEDRYQI
jgi:hypothetical protein